MSTTNRFAALLEYESLPDGLFQRVEQRELPDGSIWESVATMTGKGMDQCLLHARILEHWGDHFEALAAALPRCEHGLACDEMEWWVNDYMCDPGRDPAHVDFLLEGWHDGIRGPFSDHPGVACCPAWAHSVPAGLLVQFDAPEPGAAREGQP